MLLHSFEPSIFLASVAFFLFSLAAKSFSQSFQCVKDVFSALRTANNEATGGAATSVALAAPNAVDVGRARSISKLTASDTCTSIPHAVISADEHATATCTKLLHDAADQVKVCLARWP